MPAYGFAGHLGIAKETVWGDPIAATDYFQAMSESMTPAIDRFDITNITGAFYEPDDQAGIVRIEGDIAFAAHPIGVGYFLNGAMGTNSVSVIEADELFANEFNVSQSDVNSLHPLPAYTFEVFRDVTSSQQFAGCIMNTLELAVQPNQDLRVTAGMIGKTTTNIAKTTASFPGSPVGPLTFDTASINIGGASVTCVEAISITLDNQLEGIPALNNSTDIAKIKRTGPPMVRATGAIAFEDIVEYNKFLNQTEQQLQISLVKANSFQLTLDLPRMVYSAFPLGMGGRERQVIAFEGIGRYHTGSAAAFTAILTNTKSDY